MVLSNSPNTDDAGFVSATLMTLMNICGVISLTVVTTIYRHSEMTALMQRLVLHKIQLTAQQMHQVRMLLADPEHAARYLSHFSHQLAKQVVSLFHESFIIGMRDAYAVLLITTVVIWGASVLLCRGSKQRK